MDPASESWRAADKSGSPGAAISKVQKIAPTTILANSRVVTCGRQERVSWKCDLQGTGNRADNESGELACSAASKIAPIKSSADLYFCMAKSTHEHYIADSTSTRAQLWAKDYGTFGMHESFGDIPGFDTGVNHALSLYKPIEKMFSGFEFDSIADNESIA
jgi:hypothetical protein